MKRFLVNTPRRFYRNQNAKYEKPVQVGYFSTDGGKQYHADDSQLREFIPLDDMENFEPLNLDEGFETFISYDGRRGGLDDLFTWLTNQKEMFQLDKRLVEERFYKIIFSYSAKKLVTR